jgi:ABC-type molybdate transport system permease subunit
LEIRARFFCGFGIVGRGEIGEKSGMDVEAYLSLLGCIIVATMIAFVTGVSLAWISAKNKSPLFKITEIALTLPLIFSPTIVGTFLVLMTSDDSHGSFKIHDWITITFRSFTPLQWLLLPTIGAAALALPVVYRVALDAFRSIEGTLLDMMHVYGVAKLNVALSLARSGLALAAVCGFARAFAEFALILLLIVSPDVFRSWGNRNLPIIFTLFFAILVTITSVVALMKPCRRG